MKTGKVVTPNGTNIITGDSCLLKYGEVGFVVRYNPNPHLDGSHRVDADEEHREGDIIL